MDIRAKVEARKAELQREHEQLEAEVKAKDERVREAARVKVQKRVAVLEAGDTKDVSAPASVIAAADDEPTEDDIERELDAALGKKAQDMWTSGENNTLLVLFLGGILSFFILGWLFGLTLVVLGFIQLVMTNAKYKRQLRSELAKREAAAG
jgi:hypothetical protein